MLGLWGLAYKYLLRYLGYAPDMLLLLVLLLLLDVVGAKHLVQAAPGVQGEVSTIFDRAKVFRGQGGHIIVNGAILYFYVAGTEARAQVPEGKFLVLANISVRVVHNN